MPALRGLAKALKHLRVSRGLSGRAAGRACGIDASDLGKYERGEKGLTTATVERILDGYGATLLELAQNLDEVQTATRKARGPRSGVPTAGYELAPGVHRSELRREVEEVLAELGYGPQSSTAEPSETQVKRGKGAMATAASRR